MQAIQLTVEHLQGRDGKPVMIVEGLPRLGAELDPEQAVQLGRQLIQAAIVAKQGEHGIRHYPARESDACDWLEGLQGDAWANACEEIAASVKQQAEGPRGEWGALRSALAELDALPRESGFVAHSAAHDSAIGKVVRNARAVLAQPSPAGEYGDAYQGAREDLVIWKRRALEAEQALQEEKILTERLGNALNAESGPTFMDEPNVEQPSPAPELERPEPVGWLNRDATRESGIWLSRHRQVTERQIDEGALTEPVMTVAQHERIDTARVAEIEEMDSLVKRLGDLLSQTAITLRGPEPALTRYGYADLPLRVKALVADRDSWADQAAQRLADWEDMRNQRDAAQANVDALAVQVLKLGGTISFAAPVAQTAQEPLRLSNDVREFLQDGINSVMGGEDADVDYEFANQLGKLLDPIYSSPTPLAGQVPADALIKAMQLRIFLGQAGFADQALIADELMYLLAAAPAQVGDV